MAEDKKLAELEKQRLQLMAELFGGDRSDLFIRTINKPAPVPTFQRLKEKIPVTVAFTPCAEELLALISLSGKDPSTWDDIEKMLDEYFTFGSKHVIIEGDLATVLDQNLLNCADSTPIDVLKVRPNAAAGKADFVIGNTNFVGDCCLCSPCIRIDGTRNGGVLGSTPGIRRLFIGDLFWLFYFERMGIFQILGAVLDAFAHNGRIPISNGSLFPDMKDDVAALVLEVMVRQTKTGLASSVRDRGSAFRTTLGWTSDSARKLSLDTNVNSGFNTLFHKFIFNSLEFYKDVRLANAIQAAANPGRPSVATKTTISNTIEVLKKRFETFDYGRNYYNTLSGIVWALAAMSIIRELRTSIGIPPTYNEPHEYISAAYDLLVLKRPVTSGDANRYIVNKECAQSGRDILLDLEVINHKDVGEGGELEAWLFQIEGKIEAYRTAYRTLTGIDLGASESAKIEQEA